MQVGDKEREHDLTSVRREIATLVAEKCVDPATQRPLSVGIIEKAMTEAGFSVRPGKNAKSQVSECIKLLQTHSTLPIQRARMRVRIVIPVSVQDSEDIRKSILKSAESVEREAAGADDWEAVRRASSRNCQNTHDLMWLA